MPKKGKVSKPRPRAAQAPKPAGVAVGRRVRVTREGSFAFGCTGKVSAIDGGIVSVMLDHKAADKEFAAADLAAL